MLILPAIDLLGGQCVRLSQGDYSKEKVYNSDPVRVASEFEAQGATFIHVVDLDGAKSGEPKNWAALEGIVKAISIPIEVGGGVRSLEMAKRLLDIGIRRVVIGTKLVEDEELAEVLFTELEDKVVAGIDARDGKAAVAGWVQQSSISAVELAVKMERLGARRIILTDIAHDGMLTGPNTALLLEVTRAVKIPIIQSGGIGALSDLELLYDMKEGRPEGVIVGRAIYEGKFTVQQAVDLTESFATSERIL